MLGTYRRATFRTCGFFSTNSRNRLVLGGREVFKNDQIIFDHVRVLDQSGTFLGEMSTTEGVRLARSKGLNLNLIEYEKDPPTCVIADDQFIIDLGKKYTTQSIQEDESFSFDPTVRSATIQFSINIADEEFERKIDLLRKHLLDRRRCQVVLNDKEMSSSSIDNFEVLSNRILGEVRDIGKLVDADVPVQRPPITIRIWPCDPEQTSNERVKILTDSDGATQGIEGYLMEDKQRPTRGRVDPRIRLRRHDIISED